LLRAMILPFYGSSCGWDNRHTPLYPAFFHSDGDLKNRLYLDWPGATILLISASCMAGMTGTCMGPNYWLRWGLTNLMSWAGL
jgi:hypothetical protein